MNPNHQIKYMEPLTQQQKSKILSNSPELREPNPYFEESNDFQPNSPSITSGQQSIPLVKKQPRVTKKIIRLDDYSKLFFFNEDPMKRKLKQSSVELIKKPDEPQSRQSLQMNYKNESPCYSVTNSNRIISFRSTTPTKDQ